MAPPSYFKFENVHLALIQQVSNEIHLICFCLLPQYKLSKKI